MSERIDWVVGWRLFVGVTMAVVTASFVMTACVAIEGSGFTDDESDSSVGGASNNGTGGGFEGGPGSGGGTPGGVPQTCEQALAQQSYIGCEYWPTITSNSLLYPEFKFAVVAANPTGTTAEVTVTQGGIEIASTSVAPSGLETIELPWVNELKQQDAVGDGSALTSALVPDGAFRVVSSVPITLYQFNPLEFDLGSNPPDCPNSLLLGGCFSFTNDASLLLPTTALRNEYYVMSYPTFHIGTLTSWTNGPGFLAVTATQDGTNVTVDSSAHVRAGAGVAALAAGSQGTYSLDAGDVLMLQTAALPAGETPQPGQPCVTDNQFNTLCPGPPDYDLTGTHITSSAPINVIGGHDCTFVPYSNFACDHLEESMFPVETLGNDLVVTAPQAVAAIETAPGTPDNMFVRVLSAADGNSVSFDPAVNGTVTLNAGEWIEIGPVTQDFRVTSDDKVMVAQYMVGENFSGASVGAGDPAMSIAIPTEQYRVAYTFLAPTTYTYNFVNIVAPTGTNVAIDGAPVDPTSFTAIGGTGLSVSRLQISGGAHSMTGDNNFGIVVYGYGSYTSYIYPGGLNLETIVIVPE